ncbi:MAG: hypothetical protein KGL74_11340, partial [Elusimicrobia bacterium]|nr:hypothetical protein [Elusimicrobiota bacterium]
MKYWIFQNNQVLGPFEPNDMSQHPSFTAESLVCPEGRRGTSMGDWQRAGMVPDLSVALVKAAQSHSVRSSVATLAGLPPEPTLKDLAVLGSLQEKMALLEDVVLQLQEGLRTKDAELAALHEELAGKDRESSEMKRESSEIKQDADRLKQDADKLKQQTEVQRREAAVLKAETEEFKFKISELEERLGAVNRLSDTIEKAVEAEKHVEHDVEAQGETLAELTKEMEALRTQLHERLTAAAPPPPPAVSAPVPLSDAPAAPMPGPTPQDGGFPSIAPAPSIPMPSMAPTPMPLDAPLPSLAPLPMPSAPTSAFETAPLPAFGSPAPDAAAPAPAALESVAPVADLSPAPAPAPAKGGGKKALLFGALAGLLALAALAVYSGRLGFGKRAKPALPAPVADTTPLPPPAPVIPTPPPPDPRQTAIDAAREWQLPDGRSLGQALETLSPPNGNLSPWMAELLPNDRAMVNYFAHGGPGAPTVAYEFEVDLAAKSVTGRNAAAKAVLAGKAVEPPAPPKPRKITVKPKAKAKAKPAPKPAENLDSLLGSDSPEDPEEASPAPAPATSKTASAVAPNLDEPSGDAPQEKSPAKPPKPTAAKRAAKASAAK